VESTPLPDKKLLFFILDRVQKKDTYGVYSDPADPEELPDYYEIIKNPMDFTTLRKKLESGAYTTLEQFEASLVIESLYTFLRFALAKMECSPFIVLVLHIVKSCSRVSLVVTTSCLPTSV
jgi:hypothetical protein